MSSVTAMTPPSGRDVEIHRLNRVEHVSTYRLADRFKISQTRVRQIVYRVGEWLARVLPERSDAERERETRLAQCLAADQLQSQIEKLQVFWEETRDPKYLRQQTRAILALARLGVLPGAIDAAAADAGSEVGDQRSEVGDQPATGHFEPPISDLRPHGLEPDRPAAESTKNPPAGDCSPAAVREQPANYVDESADLLSRHAAETSDEDDRWLEADLEGLNLIERRLLTLLETTPPDDVDGRQGLENTLSNVRRERAAIELRVSPAQAGVAVEDFSSSRVA